TEAHRAGVALRFAYLYGPDSDFLRQAIGLVRIGWAPVFGADTYISSVSHDDAASAVVAALTVPAGIYNVSDDEPVTRREFFRSLAAAVGASPPKFLPRFPSYFAGSVVETLSRSLRISNRKLRAASGWSPKYPSVRDGWRHAIDHV